uniref:G domain-containing protein n=1 Tax=Chromera velia CCMP2878 TaxID=1169474 RepID=A0A0G4HYN4_9ALVE|eukprot:Cvel_9517.t1-p1 / transcript=Cvel_9517.t1 / gene=Cvel_9517 / organism=Chromera_velia_CCMP2878 / gene_product=GTPase Der, putative / transcript_product=GTPase Der, putative / location=Cvel_scaffold551:9959-15691(-) / protein_length=621 / sequence_SO=supercontig / SO=protein_coding / is_pseudo=false
MRGPESLLPPLRRLLPTLPKAHFLTARPLSALSLSGSSQRPVARRRSPCSSLLRGSVRSFSSSSSSSIVNEGAMPVRVNIGIFGAMNAGKSTFMNALTMSPISIVDAKPGTTADTKVSLMELHSLGPCKILDTAGIDEEGELGNKKRERALTNLRESDVAILVVNLASLLSDMPPHGVLPPPDLAAKLKWEALLLRQHREADEILKQSRTPNAQRRFLVFFNCPREALRAHGYTTEEDVEALVDHASQALCVAAEEDAGCPLAYKVPQPVWISKQHTAWMDLGTGREKEGVNEISTKLQEWIQKSADLEALRTAPPPVPRAYLDRSASIFLVIPMDDETPSARLLRPQQAVLECALRNFATVTCFRLDLGAARGSDRAAADRERRRFHKAMGDLLGAVKEGRPALMMTDSQAMDVVHPWTLNEKGEAMCDLTTFSIAMIQRVSGVPLEVFVKGLQAVDSLQKGDHILIAEACNHNRITVQCDDIATVQLPRGLHRLLAASAKRLCGLSHEDKKSAEEAAGALAKGKEPLPTITETASGGLVIDHAFGREFPDLLSGKDKGEKPFNLVVHCGGCMIDRQKASARVADALAAGIPVTNFGILLAYLTSREALSRVVKPWGCSV